MRYITKRDLERFKIFADIKYIGKNIIELNYAKKTDLSEVTDKVVTKDVVGKANGVASLDATGNIPLEQLGNVDNQIFVITNKLPTESIDGNKIYIIPSEAKGDSNIYTEYCYINNVWEKLGEFKAEVDLSEYAKMAEVNKLLDTKANKNEVMIVNVDEEGNQSAVLNGNSGFDTTSNISFFDNSCIKAQDERGEIYIEGFAVNIHTTDNDNGADGFFVTYIEDDNTRKVGSLTPYGVICEYLPQKDTEVLTANGKSTSLDNYVRKDDSNVLIGSKPKDNVTTNNVIIGIDNTTSAKYVVNIGYHNMVDDNASASVTIGNVVLNQGMGNISIGYATQCYADGAICLNGCTKTNYSVAIGATCTNKSIFAVGVNWNNNNPFSYIEVDNENYGLYLKNLGGYDGTNLVNDNDELNPNIKSVQQVLADKADKTSIPTKVSQLTNDSGYAKTSELGTIETFKFTLEDGTVVSKKIRIVE